MGDLSLQHLIFSSSRRPRQRPRCVASGWEVHSRIKPSSTCDRAPTFLTRANDSGGHDFQLRQQVSTLAAHALRLYDERSSAPQLPGRIPCSMSNVDALLSMNVEAARTTPLYDDRRIADRRISTAHP